MPVFRWTKADLYVFFSKFHFAARIFEADETIVSGTTKGCWKNSARNSSTVSFEELRTELAFIMDSRNNNASDINDFKVTRTILKDELDIIQWLKNNFREEQALCLCIYYWGSFPEYVLWLGHTYTHTRTHTQTH